MNFCGYSTKKWSSKHTNPVEYMRFFISLTIKLQRIEVKFLIDVNAYVLDGCKIRRIFHPIFVFKTKSFKICQVYDFSLYQCNMLDVFFFFLKCLFWYKRSKVPLKMRETTFSDMHPNKGKRGWYRCQISNSFFVRVVQRRQNKLICFS